MTILAAAGTGKTMWYLTRGSGAVALILLTASMCLGIVSALQWRGTRVPRLTTAALHRNLTLLAVAFLGIHVATTIADSYTPIGVKDAFVPFLSPYRPLWLGLGTIACDLLLALVITSLLRVRIGYRTWRFTHWLAYACWPVALVHALGTGSDPRTGWFQALAAGSVAAVLLAVALRLVGGDGDRGRRIALGGAAGAVAILGGAWYGNGPGAPGWAKRAGTPPTLLHTSASTIRAQTVSAIQTPSRFSARLSGTVTQSQTANGLVDVHLDGKLGGGVNGRLRLVLEGVPLDDGGVSMTASGVAFAARGSSVYEGQIVGLDGNRLTARVSDTSGHTLELALDLRLQPDTNTLAGTVHGSPA